MYSWLLRWICLSLKQEMMWAKGLWTPILWALHGRSGWRASSASAPPPHHSPCCVFGLRSVGCKQLMSYCLCNNVSLNLSLWWWILLPFSTRVIHSFPWNLLSYTLSSEEILTQKTRMLFWSVWTLLTELLLWTGETSVSKCKGFMVGHLGSRCCTIPKSPGRKRAEPGAVQEECSAESPFVIQGHRTHKSSLL